MDERQSEVREPREINNSIAGAAVCLCLKPETVSIFLPYMIDYESCKGQELIYRLRSFEYLTDFLYQRIEDLSNAVQKQHEEAVKLQQEIKRLEKKVA